MNWYTISLGRILGIPIGLDPSWFLIFILLTWTLASSYFPTEFKNWSAAQYWIIGAITAILFFVSVLLHELGHSVVALRYKIPVRRITLFVFGGVAQIGAEPPSALSEFWIAIAGPVVSFALAASFYLLQLAFAGLAPLFALAKYLAFINGTLGLFNLIPGFPLDGGRVFRAIVWGLTKNLRRATLIAANLGRAIAFMFILYGVWQVLTGHLGNGLWIAFIGWFLESAATSQAQQQIFHDLLAGHTVKQAMNRNYVAVSALTTLQDLVDQHILGSGQRVFVVIDQSERVIGILTLHHVKEIPRPAWPTTLVEQAMTPLTQVKWVSPDSPIKSALAEMDQNGVNQLPVMVNGQMMGMLTREGVISFLRIQQELGL